VAAVGTLLGIVVDLLVAIGTSDRRLVILLRVELIIRVVPVVVVAGKKSLHDLSLASPDVRPRELCIGRLVESMPVH
jgi:hypothetical protein